MKPQLQGAALLSACLERLEWGPERLAREVNRVAGEEVVSAKAGYGWLKGSVPRGRTPQLVALVISKALGEIITTAALWPESRVGGVALTSHHGLDLPWTVEGALRCAELISTPTGGTLMPISGPMLVASAVDWLTVPTSPSPRRRSGDHLSKEVADVLTERISQLRRLDDTQSSPLLLDLVTNDLRLAADLATHSSYDPETGARLFGVLAQLGQLAGWVAVDMERKALGQRFLLASLRFAHAAGDTELAANILSCLSYQTLWTGDGSSAVRLIRLARQGTLHDAHPLVTALLASREGRAHAVLGDAIACARALEDASLAYADFDPSTDRGPSWAYWVSEGVLTADAGRAWLEAGKAEHAVPLLSRGLELLTNEQPRNRLLHGVSLAHAQLLLGEADAAVQATDAALEIARVHGPSRVRVRLNQLRGELLSQPFAEARGLADRIADVVGA